MDNNYGNMNDTNNANNTNNLNSTNNVNFTMSGNPYNPDNHRRQHRLIIHLLRTIHRATIRIHRLQQQDRHMHISRATLIRMVRHRMPNIRMHSTKRLQSLKNRERLESRVHLDHLQQRQ